MSKRHPHTLYNKREQYINKGKQNNVRLSTDESVVAEQLRALNSNFGVSDQQSVGSNPQPWHLTIASSFGWDVKPLVQYLSHNFSICAFHNYVKPIIIVWERLAVASLAFITPCESLPITPWREDYFKKQAKWTHRRLSTSKGRLNYQLHCKVDGLAKEGAVQHPCKNKHIAIVTTTLLSAMIVVLLIFLINLRTPSI